MFTKKQIIITIGILIILIISGLFISNEIVEEKNKDYCLSYEFGNCPEDRCYSAYCPEFTDAKSACCPNGLFE